MAQLNLSALADKALEIGDDYVISELPEVFKNDAQSLLNMTAVFLNNIKDLYIKIQLYNLIKKVEHQIRNGIQNTNVSEYQRWIWFYKKYAITDKEFQLFMSQIFKYQQGLMQYLGKQMKTLYLYQDGNNVIIYEAVGDTTSMLKQDIASRGGGLSARYKEPDFSNSTFKQLQMVAANKDYVTPTYLETLRRGQLSRTEGKVKNGMLILWKPDSVWKKMFVAGGAGDLGEAYLYFMMDEERIKKFHGNMEPDIDTFLLSGVALVDNISGLLKGDFDVGDIEYAAKSAGASAMGYKQVISFANKISKSSVEDIAKYMTNSYKRIQNKAKEKKGTRNKAMEASMNDTVDKLLSELITSSSQT